ncbi:hypothetical protein AB0I10_18840 [Streptomyces sp. NPDC050636]|uniref:hypothetical protein n=1 Tax=Streptomyces sp. NPDC050636 TaxID=3154510 RepID=UPI00342061FC
MSDSDFAVQVTAKLESIQKEIDELQQLKAKLEDLRQHLGTDPQGEAVAPPAVETDTAAPKPVTVPPARRAQAATPKAKPAKAKPAKKTPAKAAGSAKNPRKATARGKAQPKSSTRADRVLGLLDEQPRTVSEMTELLAQQHPDHTAPETAVRNTLETSLVAKGLAHRSKQGRSVFYSLPVPAPKADTEAHEANAVDANSEEVAPTPA